MYNGMSVLHSMGTLKQPHHFVRFRGIFPEGFYCTCLGYVVTVNFCFNQYMCMCMYMYMYNVQCKFHLHVHVSEIWGEATYLTFCIKILTHTGVDLLLYMTC